MLTNLQKTQNRRKAVVLISNGYDLIRSPSSRAGTAAMFSELNATSTRTTPAMPLFNQGNQFNDAELSMRLAELTRQANRANATIYAFDLRGLVAGGDIDEPVDPVEWEQHLRKEQDSLRVLAEQTGGIRGGEHERPDQGHASNRCRDERLLRARVLLHQSRPDPASPEIKSD